MRQLSPCDKLISRLDRVLRTVSGNSPRSRRANPAASRNEGQLTPEERKYAGRLMRVNHCGEVCAQALYAGQALTSRSSRTKASMQAAADEEQDHLSWCQDRLRELDTPVSRLNPFFHALSYGVGALTGLLGDRVSLGFVAATEEQVVKHLDEHLERLPEGDLPSRAILTRMRDEEESHKATAMNRGGAGFPPAVKSAMTLASRVMTRSTYWL